MFRAHRPPSFEKLLLWLVIAAMLPPGAFAEHADIVIFGGAVVTLDPALPEATALAVRGDRILAVGNDSTILAMADDSTKRIDAQGRAVLPGFIEGHGHFLSFGESRMRLDLSEARTWDEVVQQVAAAAKETPPGKWIVGRGWHQGKWREPPAEHIEGYPVHDALSRVAPDHPVLLTHGTGHMVLANALAMRLAGITASTPDPAGGVILRKAQGEPSGVFRENAMAPLYRAAERARSELSKDERAAETRRALLLAQEACFAHGVTSFQDAGASLDDVAAMRALMEEGSLQIRLYVMLNESNAVLAARMAQARCVGDLNHRLTVRAIKRMHDGALGTHGAYLLEPYDDLPGSVGHVVTDANVIAETARLALLHDYQLCVHAIGDRSNREMLDLFERAFADRQGGGASLRWRIEHAQHLHPDDIPRFGRLGVLASMQGCHATSDGPFVVQRLGWRRAREGAYAWRSLLDTGATIVNGTDVPVERISPLECFVASVTRRMADGETFFAEQAMTRAEALRSYTINAAYGAFEEDLKGSLTPGKLADVVIVSHHPLTATEEDLRQARVLMTLVGGRIVFRHAAF